MTDLEKLLALVQGGNLSQSELRDIGDSLRKSLSPAQAEMLGQITKDRKSTDAFLNSPEVKRILGGD
ncbi:MAG: hypothetical protein IJ766_01970 [Clostridia bacterium]|nr:hypothetical protein [Clostridia bacterium]